MEVEVYECNARSNWFDSSISICVFDDDLAER